MTGFALSFSDKLGPLGPRVKSLVKDYSRIWEESDSATIPPGRSFSLSEKKAVERELSLIIDGIMHMPIGPLRKKVLSKPSKQQAFGKRHMQEVDKHAVKRDPGEKRESKRNWPSLFCQFEVEKSRDH